MHATAKSCTQAIALLLLFAQVSASGESNEFEWGGTFHVDEGNYGWTMARLAATLAALAVIPRLCMRTLNATGQSRAMLSPR